LKFTRGDTVVDFGKLWFLQKRHAARYASSPNPSNPSHDLNEIALKPIFALLEHNSIYHSGLFQFYHAIPSTAREDYVRDILWADAKKYTNPAEFVERNTFFWVSPTSEILVKNMPALRLHNVPSLAAQPTPAALSPFFSNFSEIPEEGWNAAEIKSWILSIVEQASSRSFAELTIKNKHWSETDADAARIQWSKAWNKLVHQYLRWALMGAMPGPDGAETMRILGRNETLRRLERAEELILLRAEDEKNEKAGHNREEEGEVRPMANPPNPPPGYQKAEPRGK
jgi:glutamyl-tRNA synthetase